MSKNRIGTPPQFNQTQTTQPAAMASYMGQQQLGAAPPDGGGMLGQMAAANAQAQAPAPQWSQTPSGWMQTTQQPQPQPQQAAQQPQWSQGPNGWTQQSGLDPNAIAANPQGFANWQQGAAQQAAQLRGFKGGQYGGGKGGQMPGQYGGGKGYRGGGKGGGTPPYWF